MDYSAIAIWNYKKREFTMKRILMLFILAVLVIINVSALTLDQCLESARQSNKELLSAKEDIVIADALYYDVRGMLLPQISLVGAYQLTNTKLPDSVIPGKVDFTGALDNTASGNDSTLAGVMTGIVNGMIPSQTQKEGSLAAQLKLEQILFSGGKLINGVNAVNRYRSIQKLRYKLLEQEVISKTTDMFYQTILAQKVYEIQQEALNIATKHLTRVELLNREGQISEYDLLRAKLEVAKLRPNVVHAHNMYDLAMAAFAKQIGSKDSLLVLEGEFVLPELSNEELNSAISAAEKKRIELQLASINTEISKIKYNAEKGSYLPNVALTGAYSLYTKADEYAIESKDFGTSYNIGIGFSLPIFTGFSNTAKRSYAKHEYFQAQIKETDAQEWINLEVKQSKQNLQNSLENYNVQLENIKLAERSLQLAQLRFENQVGIQLEVFDAQMMLSSVKLSYYNSIYEVISANQKFRKAMGFTL
jgi:outer membrane protein TolC